MLYDDLSEAVSHIRAQCPLKPLIGIVLGSGLGAFADSVKQEWSQEYAQIPYFGATSIEGHKGKLILGTLGKTPVALLQGRIHLYEGHSMGEVVFPTRVLAMLGIQALIVTNAAGGLNKKMKAGDLMIIEDHINLMGDNPLRGKNMDQLGPRFPDMSEAYDHEFITLAKKIAKKQKLTIRSGVYIGLPGPTYETPAEVRYLRAVGGAAVGMSTVPEVIAANHFGVRVCGISCITNLAAGITKAKLSHAEVTSIGKEIAPLFQNFVGTLVEEMAKLLEAEHAHPRHRPPVVRKSPGEPK